MARSWSDILPDEEKAFVAALKGQEDTLCPDLKRSGCYLYCGKGMPPLTPEQKIVPRGSAATEAHPYFIRHRTMRDVEGRCACDYNNCGFFKGQLRF